MEKFSGKKEINLLVCNVIFMAILLFSVSLIDYRQAELEDRIDGISEYFIDENVIAPPVEGEPEEAPMAEPVEELKVPESFKKTLKDEAGMEVFYSNFYPERSELNMRLQNMIVPFSPDANAEPGERYTLDIRHCEGKRSFSYSFVKTDDNFRIFYDSEPEEEMKEGISFFTKKEKNKILKEAKRVKAKFEDCSASEIIENEKLLNDLRKFSLKDVYISFNEYYINIEVEPSKEESEEDSDSANHMVIEPRAPSDPSYFAGLQSNSIIFGRYGEVKLYSYDNSKEISPEKLVGNFKYDGEKLTINDEIIDYIISFLTK